MRFLTVRKLEHLLGSAPGCGTSKDTLGALPVKNSARVPGEARRRIGGTQWNRCGALESNPLEHAIRKIGNGTAVGRERGARNVQVPFRSGERSRLELSQ